MTTFLEILMGVEVFFGLFYLILSYEPGIHLDGVPSQALPILYLILFSCTLVTRAFI